MESVGTPWTPAALADEVPTWLCEDMPNDEVRAPFLLRCIARHFFLRLLISKCPVVRY